MREIGIGLIGTGFMGKAHALAYRTAKAVLGDVPAARLEILCDTPADKARQMAEQFDFARSTDNWREVVQDPRVEIVSITTPNHMHREIALAAIAAGKHVHCEKPMGLTLAEAEEMTAAAKRAGVKTIVGYNYIKNPAFLHARTLIREGAIGRIIHFRGWVDEDYQADPDLPWSWRARLEEAGLGALGDMGCHLVSMAYDLMGPIASLVADMQTVHETRATPDGTDRKKVENEDTASALVRFESGAHGSLSTSRTAWGRKNRLDWEVHGTKGMLVFAQERMNELHLYQNEGDRAQQGFKTIFTGPDHPPYGNFCPAPGHQLGFNDLKTLEAGAFLRWVAGGEKSSPDFFEALEYERVIHAIAAAAREERRVAV
ncbi:Gfo/Idh/MocA family protein [Chelativorans sp. YIM 93263]|uniref:Gfo/Idh/MocA family protein n=1 Tax=Chelativorans sp. YIM 93263 TaxID=2906648 RepID=UPI002379366F|nr:Gfo/Idh/MocA family oxidoreductase [Chelativorans sp. YIM 93263]